METKNYLSSRTIANLRFPLMLGVVLCHIVVIDPKVATSLGMNFVAYFVELMTYKATAPCVPLFFFISGYLFFLKFGDKFTIVDYASQLKKRLRTLVVPYVFWNLVVLGYFAFLHKCVPSLINPAFNNVYQFSLSELCRTFWDFPGGQPICYQFWFLKDLLLAVILSPILFMLLKYGRWYFLVLLVVTYIYDIRIFPHQMMLTFFSLGAGFAIHKWDFVAISKKWVKVSAPLFVILVTYASMSSGWGIERGLVTITGGMTFIYGASKLGNQNGTLGESAFFVYAFHGFPVLMLSKIIVAILKPSTSVMWIICYIGCFITIVLLSLYVYTYMKRFFPKFTSFITGGR